MVVIFMGMNIIRFGKILYRGYTFQHIQILY
nr:MAG TPA: hypothetical protein [Caudoviricetes sp.]